VLCVEVADVADIIGGLSLMEVWQLVEMAMDTSPGGQSYPDDADKGEG
jgi:hypothetical protein